MERLCSQQRKERHTMLIEVDTYSCGAVTAFRRWLNEFDPNNDR